MKLTDILEGDVINFPKKQKSQSNQTQSDQKGSSTYSKIDIQSSPERDAVIRLLKRLTTKTIGDWLWLHHDDGTPSFALTDDYWKTFISHPSGETETAEQQVEQRVKKLIKQIEKNGMSVAKYNLEKLAWRDKDNPNKRSWMLTVHFDEKPPQFTF